MSGFSNAVVGGAEYLIRSAIKSANYILNVAGWRIAKDGSAEFNSAVVRGSLSAGGGNVTLNSTGFHLTGVTTQYDINATAGFFARNLPADGGAGQLVPGGLFLYPLNPSPLGLTTPTFMGIFVGYQNPGAANEQIFSTINSPMYSGKAAPFIAMYSQAANDAGTDDTSLMNVSAHQISLIGSTILPSDNALQDSFHHYYLRGENGAFIRPAVAGPTNYSDPVTFTHPFANPPNVQIAIQDGSGANNYKTWVVRPINVTTTGFTSFFYQPNVVAPTGAANITITWVATEYTP